MIASLEAVSFAYRPDREDAVRGVSLDVAAGEHTAIVGPNGAGKSTLLRLLIGLLRAREGRVALFGRAVDAWPRRQLARRVAVVAQDGEVAVPMTLRALVELGRNPYVRPWAPLGRDDRRAVDAAIEATDLETLANRDIRELSGGELQRARLARALAQDPELLLLDEPTAHLDLGHEMGFFELVHDLTMEQSVTVVSITHHLNVAARFASRMVLMADGRVHVAGAPGEVMAPDHLESAFRWPVAVEDLGPLGRHAVPVRRAGRKSAE
jgi:iron complex transport system ATP-binding protein